MPRLVSLSAAATAALILALPAAADGMRAARGVVTSVTSTSIAVRGEGHGLRCAVTASSPSVAAIKVGDRAAIACRRIGDVLVLAKVKHLIAAAPTAGDTAQVTFGGAVTAVSDSSVSLHDGNRDITCSLGDSSPKLTGVKVGDHAKVTCAAGVLITFTPITIPTSPPAATTGGGTVSALTTTSITVHNSEHGDVTCALASSSPSVGEIHIGDVVRFGCVGGTLVAVSKLTTTVPPPPTPTTTPPATIAFGTITTLTSAALTIHNPEHGDLTCTLGEHSPALGDFHVGDRVRIGCSDGAMLLSIARY